MASYKRCYEHHRITNILPSYTCANQIFPVFFSVYHSKWRADGGHLHTLRTVDYSDKEYVLYEEIDIGGYGALFYARRGDKHYVVKICVDYLNQGDTEDFCREIVVSSAINERIKTFIGCVKYTDIIVVYDGHGYHGAVVMEQYDGDSNDLFDDSVISEYVDDSTFLHMWLQFCIQTAITLTKLHSAHIYHSDIKATNVLYNVSGCNSIQFFITDFGISGIFNNMIAPCKRNGTVVPKKWIDKHGDASGTVIDDEAEAAFGDVFAYCRMLTSTCTRKLDKLESFLKYISNPRHVNLQKIVALATLLDQ